MLEDRVVPTIVDLTTPGASGVVDNAFFIVGDFVAPGRKAKLRT